jgi:peptidoglycan/LPS O-acetylase OafA/YrhL
MSDRPLNRPTAGDRTPGGAPGTSLDHSRGRVAELDSLRGIAALTVLVYHVNEARLPFGWAAVDLFFVLSGYLITGIILRSGGVPGFLRTFYIRRGLRTWPIYYLTLFVLVALSPLFPRAFPWSRLPDLLTYTQGLSWFWSGSASSSRPYLAHLWSLAVEEQFYLVWPALVLLIGRGRGRVAALAVACAAASALARGNGVLLSLLPARADGLALGGLLATLPLAPGEAGRARDAVRVALVLAIVAALGMLAPLGARSGLGNFGLWSAPGRMVLAFNLLWAGVIGLVAAHPGHRLLGWLRSRPLRRIGQISYGVYLYHLPLVVILPGFAWRLGVPLKVRGVEVVAFSALAMSVGVAALSWRFIERPLLDLKDRFDYRPAAAGAVPPPHIATAVVGRVDEPGRRQ